MKHFIFLFHLLSFFMGFMSIQLAVTAYIKFKKQVIRDYIFFIAALTMILVQQTFVSYEIINLVEPSLLNNVLNAAEYLASSCIIFFLPRFAHQLMQKEWKKTQDYLFKIAAFFPVGALILYHLSGTKIKAAVLSSSLLFLVIVYGIIFLFVHVESIASDYLKRILKCYLVIAVLAVPYMYLDTRIEHMAGLNQLFPYGLLSVPVFYFLWSLLSIYFGIRYFRIQNDKIFTAVNEEETEERLKQEELFFQKFNITNREKEIIELLIKGYSYNQLADELVISITTVKTHVHNIYKKVGVKNKMELLYLMKEKES